MAAPGTVRPGDGASHSANCQAEQDQHITSAGHAALQQRGNDSDGHPDHAKAVALTRGLWMRKAAQRQNEQDSSSEIGE